MEKDFVRGIWLSLIACGLVAAAVLSGVGCGPADPPPTGDGGTCPQGQKYDDVLGKCMPMTTTDGSTNPDLIQPPTCGTQTYAPATCYADGGPAIRCVFDTVVDTPIGGTQAICLARCKENGDVVFRVAASGMAASGNFSGTIADGSALHFTCFR